VSRLSLSVISLHIAIGLVKLSFGQIYSQSVNVRTCDWCLRFWRLRVVSSKHAEMVLGLDTT
jgi:hypothetical protein